MGKFTTLVDVTVEAAFGDNPLTTGRTWTDITGDVRRIKTDRGRDHFFDRVAVGRADILLNNTGGQYDPSATTGAYWPDVKAMVPVRVTAHTTLAGSAGALVLDDGTAGQLDQENVAVSTTAAPVPLFTGFAERWDQWFDDGQVPRVRLRAVDAIKLFNLIETDGTRYGPGNVAQQIKSVLVDRGWPTVWFDAYNAEFTAQSHIPNGTVLRALQRLQDTEHGLLFVQADGDVMYQNRGYRSTLSPVATFGDGTGELPYWVDAVFPMDDQQVWNKVTVQRSGGDEQTQSSQSSIDSYLERELKLRDTLHATDVDALVLAVDLLNWYDEPHVRLERITFNPRQNPTELFPVALTYDISEMVTVNRRPGRTMTFDRFIEGVEHDIEPGKWETSFRLSEYGRTTIIKDWTHRQKNNTITRPLKGTDGDTLLIFVGRNTAFDFNTTGFTGFTLDFTTGDSAGDPRSIAWYSMQTTDWSGGSTSFTWNSDGFGTIDHIVCMVARGVTGFSTQNTDTASPASTSDDFDSPAVNNTEGDLLIRMYYASETSGAATAQTPAGYTQIINPGPTFDSTGESAEIWFTRASGSTSGTFTWDALAGGSPEIYATSIVYSR